MRTAFIAAATWRTAASRSRWNSPCRTTHSPSFTTRRCNIKTRIISQPDSDAAAKVCGQFDQLLEHLVGKTVSSVSDLYLPGQIADDTDVSTGATLRAPKVISAIWDALGRRAYVIIK